MRYLLIAATILAAFSCSIRAQADDYLIINGISQHVDSSKTYNETNYGLGYAWDTNWLGFDVTPQLGFFNNSENDMTAYANGTFYFAGTSKKRLKFGTMIGVAVGYEKSPIMPMAGLVMTVQTLKGVGANFLLTAYRDGDNGVKPLIALQFQIPLGKK